MTQPGNDLEKDLRQALRRKDPSADFAARVLARLPQEHEQSSRWFTWMSMPALRWAATAVIVVAASTGGYLYRQHQQEVERGRIVKQQLMLALRITGSKLQIAQQRVQQIGADQPSVSQQETEKAQ